jgi:hypothetical protein
MTKKIHTVTLGDLVAAAFDRAERTSELPIVVREVAGRDLEARLRRFNRADLILTLASTERGLRTRARPTPARGRMAIAAAG